MSDPRDRIRSVALQDQEWAEACDWLRESDPEMVALLAMAAVADDPQALLRLMERDGNVLLVVQRMVALVLVEAAQRNTEPAGEA